MHAGLSAVSGCGMVRKVRVMNEIRTEEGISKLQAGTGKQLVALVILVIGIKFTSKALKFVFFNLCTHRCSLKKINSVICFSMCSFPSVTSTVNKYLYNMCKQVTLKELAGVKGFYTIS